MESIIDLSELNFNVNSISYSVAKPTGTGPDETGPDTSDQLIVTTGVVVIFSIFIIVLLLLFI